MAMTAATSRRDHAGVARAGGETTQRRSAAAPSRNPYTQSTSGSTGHWLLADRTVVAATATAVAVPHHTRRTFDVTWSDAVPMGSALGGGYQPAKEAKSAALMSSAHPMRASGCWWTRSCAATATATAAATRASCRVEGHLRTMRASACAYHNRRASARAAWRVQTVEDCANRQALQEREDGIMACGVARARPSCSRSANCRASSVS